MLDLDARVHLDEIELAGVDVLQEFDGTGVAVLHRLREAHGSRRYLFALCRRQVRRRRALDDFLVSPLHRAVALEQVYDLAVRIADDLHFDMPCIADQFLEINLVVAERGLRLATRCCDLVEQPGLGFDDAHAAATAAPARLQHDRKTDLVGELQDLRTIVGQRVRRGHDRHVGLDRQRTCLHLVAEAPHRFRRRADERNTGIGTQLGKIRILGKEAVARVDGIGAALLRDANDVVHVEISRERPLAFADLVGLACAETMQRQAILGRVDADGRNVQLARRAKHADRDLAAIGDENFFEHRI